MIKVQIRNKRGRAGTKAITGELEKKIKEMTEPYKAKDGLGVTVGLHKDAQGYPKHERGKDLDGGTTSVVMVGAMHELGAGNFPARRWLTTPIKEHKEKWADQLETMIKSKNPAPVLRALGRSAVQTIRTDVENNLIGMERNAPSTALAKGGNTPMVDTGFLLRQVDYKVRGV